MSQNRLRFDGLDKLITDLRNLPETLRTEAGHLIEATANGAAVKVRSAYGKHRRSGNLQDHVVVDHKTTAFGVRSVVRSTARHAHLFEFGTKARHKGLKPSIAPAHPTFIPIMEADRREMYERLKEFVARQGLEVSGHA